MASELTLSLIRRLLANLEWEGECLIWTGSRDDHGYGHIATTHAASPKRVHRLAYELFIGPLEPHDKVRHRCDNPPCIRHLIKGTQKDNIRDASERGRLNPKSLLNLRPGARGFHGAGPRSNGELQWA